MTSAIHVVGTVTSTLLIESPANVFYLILISGTTDNFIPYPYIFGFLTCLFGVITSLVEGAHDIGFLAVNVFGTVVQGLFVYLFRKKTTNIHIKHIITRSTGGGVVVIGLIMIVFILPTKRTREIFDVLICVFTIASNMASLPVVPEVVQTRRVTYLPLAPIICLIMNSAIVLAISVAENDPYDVMSSLFGCFFGTGLGIFYMIYYIIQRMEVGGVGGGTMNEEGSHE